MRPWGLVVYLWVVAVALVVAVGNVNKKKSGPAGSNKAVLDDSFFEQWNSFKELESFILQMAKRYKKTKLVKLTTLGKTPEHRALHLMSLGPSNPKYQLMLMGTMHGREWVTPHAVLYIAWRLMRGLDENDPRVLELFKETQVHFLPLLNPDGYEFTRLPAEKNEQAREWRKNRRNLCSKCERAVHGIDLNRNWGVKGKSWGFGSDRATAEVYQGKRPFSEPEIKAVRDWLLKHKRGQAINGFFDVHCCSGAVLPPFYYSGEDEELQKTNLEHCGQIAKAMKSVNKARYKHRPRESEFSDSNTGIGVDWIYAEAKVQNVFLVETRGNKTKLLKYIFEVPETFIVPIAQEVEAGFWKMAELFTSVGGEPGAANALPAPADSDDDDVDDEDGNDELNAKDGEDQAEGDEGEVKGAGGGAIVAQYDDATAKADRGTLASIAPREAALLDSPRQTREPAAALSAMSLDDLLNSFGESSSNEDERLQNQRAFAALEGFDSEGDNGDDKGEPEAAQDHALADVVEEEEESDGQLDIEDGGSETRDAAASAERVDAAQNPDLDEPQDLSDEFSMSDEDSQSDEDDGVEGESTEQGALDSAAPVQGAVDDEAEAEWVDQDEDPASEPSSRDAERGGPGLRAISARPEIEDGEEAAAFGDTAMDSGSAEEIAAKDAEDGVEEDGAALDNLAASSLDAKLDNLAEIDEVLDMAVERVEAKRKSLDDMLDEGESAGATGNGFNLDLAISRDRKSSSTLVERDEDPEEGGLDALAYDDMDEETLDRFADKLLGADGSEGASAASPLGGDSHDKTSLRKKYKALLHQVPPTREIRGKGQLIIVKLSTVQTQAGLTMGLCLALVAMMLFRRQRRLRLLTKLK